MTGDLAAWLTAVWDEEERLATKAANRNGVFDPHWRVRDFPYEGISLWNDEEGGGFQDAQTRHVERHDPASVLARIAADRKILAMHTGNHECPSAEDNCGWWTPGEAVFEGDSDVLTPGPYCPTILLLASPHADKPGFRSEWLVERQGVEQ